MEHLIESVRKYPCLWKVDSQDYKDNELKEAAWREVIKDCDLPTVKEAKTLWKKLRDGHRQATGSRKKTTSGQASNITTKWKYEDQMSFLLPNMKNRPVHTNIHTDSLSEDSEASNASEVHNTSTSGEQQTASVSGIENFQPPKKNKSIVNILEQDLKRREKRSAERDILRKQILDGTVKNVSSSNKAMEKFFMSMCDAACELPTHLQMRIQRQVFNIVMEAKEQHHMQTQRVPDPGYTTNYNHMSPPSYLNSPMHPVSPSSLSSNSPSSDYLQSPAHYSLQIPPTASNTPMMPPNNNDTELIRQFSQQDNAAADAYYSGHHVQNPLPESSSAMTPQNTTHISTHDSVDLRSFVANFDTTNNE